MGTGTTPGGHARYPGYDVLGQAPTWDPVTRGVVLRRLGPPPPVRFFTPAEEAVARPLLDRLLAQDDEPRVPVFEHVDARLDTGRQKRLLEAVRVGDRWHGLPARRVWSLWMRYALAGFYSHPWAWNEIGFGGPAYPRGYKNIDLNGLEPWEAREARPRDPEAWAARIERARRDHGA